MTEGPGVPAGMGAPGEGAAADTAARVLIVEDHPANMELALYVLDKFGYRTLGVESAEHALAEVHAFGPHLVLCDIQLPGMDGFELLRRFRADARLAGIPMLAVTAYAMVGDRERALAAGFDSYLAKPIHPQTLLDRVRELLQTPASPGRT